MDFDSDGGGLAITKKYSKTARRHTRQLESFQLRLHNLGWRSSFLNSHFADNDSIGEELDEQPEDILLEEYTKSWVPEDCRQIGDALYAAGLCRKVVRKLSDVVTPLVNTCYSNRQLVEIAIEYALGKYKKVLNKEQQYLIDTPDTDVWVPNDTFNYVCNISNSDLLSGPLHTLPGTHAGGRLFFHATNYASAIYIATRGIAHLKGRWCLDFGIQPSFYMTPDITTAIDWCVKNKKRWGDEMCIIVYNIPLHDSLRAMNGKAYDTATEEWVRLVTSSRRCEEDSNEMDDLDVVYGPMASNVKDIKDENKMAKPHRPLRFQLASKSNKSDRYFGKHFAGTMFFKAATS